MSTDKKGSMFAKLIDQQAKATTENSPPVVEAQPAEPPVVQTTTKAATPKRARPAQPEPARASGKRSDPTYAQTLCYVPLELRKMVDRELLDMPGMDRSDLITDLLTKWLKSRGKPA